MTALVQECTAAPVIPLLNSEEAAAFLKISVAALRVRVHRRQVTAYRNGRRLYFRKVDLAATLTPVGNEANG